MHILDPGIPALSRSPRPQTVGAATLQDRPSWRGPGPGLVDEVVGEKKGESRRRSRRSGEGGDGAGAGEEGDGAGEQAAEDTAGG